MKSLGEHDTCTYYYVAEHYGLPNSIANLLFIANLSERLKHAVQQN